MNLYKEQMLKHGVEWRKHKYIRKEGNRYIYPEDLAGNAGNALKGAAQTVGNAFRKAGQGVQDFGRGFKEGYNSGKAYGRQYVEKNGKMSSKEEYSDMVNKAAKDAVFVDESKRRNYGALSAEENERLHREVESAYRDAKAKNASKHEKQRNIAIGITNSKQTEAGKRREELNRKANETINRTNSGVEAGRRRLEKAQEQVKKKERDQIRSAHNNYTIRERRKSLPGPASAPSLEAKKEETIERKKQNEYIEKQRANSEIQRKSAHPNHEAMRKSYTNSAIRYNKNNPNKRRPSTTDDWHRTSPGLERAMRKKKAKRNRGILTGQRQD